MAVRWHPEVSHLRCPALRTTVVLSRRYFDPPKVRVGVYRIMIGFDKQQYLYKVVLNEVVF